MLKFKLFAVAAVAMLAFTACGSSAPKADASSAVESAAKDASSAVESAKDSAASEASSESGAETTAVESTTAK